VTPPEIVPDSERSSLVAALPARIRELVLLARFDRPIGAWLLFWPGAWAIALAGGAFGAWWQLLVLFAIGAIVMRGAGCVYNDIVDRKLDARVARTRDRPLASGRVSVRAAWIVLVALSLIGLLVLLSLDPFARIVGVASLAPVAAYPFMKRITWWPQAWLGIVFSWAALVGWAAVLGRFEAGTLLLYAGSIAWVIGYDTIYAVQDLEDDALAGVRSSARALGGRVKVGVAGFFGAAVLLWAGALWTARPEPLALVAVLPVALHLGWQAAALQPTDGADALAKFRSNRDAGMLMFLACLTIGTAARL
jgi:4-hydroxybenzoate polyprenyltransferase